MRLINIGTSKVNMRGKAFLKMICCTELILAVNREETVLYAFLKHKNQYYGHGQNVKIFTGKINSDLSFLLILYFWRESEGKSLLGVGNGRL